MLLLGIVAGLYLGSYFCCRASGMLVRSYHHLHEDGWFVRGNSNLIEHAYRPAWLLERKTRSLIWRIENGAPLTGHVYCGQLNH